MTQDQWLTCTDPQRMLGVLGPRVSVRKARLVGVACCRAVWDRFTRERRTVVDVAERHADGAATDADLLAAWRAASVARDLAFGPASDAPRRHQSRAGRGTSWAAHNLTAQVAPAYFLATVVEALSYLRSARRGWLGAARTGQADLIRCVAGNPFRPVTFAPAWRTADAVALAESIYARRAFHDLPVLADALEDAGCDAADLLAHLRGPGPHARGCWAVDLVLGRA